MPNLHEFAVLALDVKAIAGRAELIRTLPPALIEAGRTIRVTGHLFGPGRVTGASAFGNGEDSLVSLGYLAETSAELLFASHELLLNGRRYASAALIRQLVEFEYLTWTFGQAPDAAAEWLASSREDRLRAWQPRHLRERSGGRFDVGDYQQHCENGGHPTPRGIRALLTPSPRDEAVMDETIRYEICHHGSAIWEAVVIAALEAHVTSIANQHRDSLTLALAAWRGSETLSQAGKGFASP